MAAKPQATARIRQRPPVSKPAMRPTSKASEAKGGNRRAAKQAMRREAIFAAALDEFSARGFAAARLDDVAKRAGVAKGTIYLYFNDKDALFQELVRHELGPVIAAITMPVPPAASLRSAFENFVGLFVHEIYETRRRDVLRLVMTEGARFPAIADFYYCEVVAPALKAMRRLIVRGLASGEIRHEALRRFPHLAVAPFVFSVVWSGLFSRLEPLDVAGLFRAHLDILFGGSDE